MSRTNTNTNTNSRTNTNTNSRTNTNTNSRTNTNTNSRKSELTWDAKSARWKKKYNGVQLYLSPRGTKKSDRAAYQQAVEVFRQKRADIDRQAESDKPYAVEYEAATMFRETIADFCVRELDSPHPVYSAAGQLEVYRDELRTMHRRMQSELTQLRQWFAQVKPKPLNRPETLAIFPLRDFPVEDILRWQQRLDVLATYHRWQGQTPQSRTVEFHVDDFLKHKRNEAASGQVKPTTYKAISDRLQHFRSYAGTRDATKIDEQLLRSFHSYMMDRITKGELSQSYAKHIVAVVKTFVRHLWHEGILEHLPRNIGNLSIRVETTDIQTFTVDEITSLLDNASDRTKLYILLMLNTGMLPMDVAMLKQEQVNWQTGIITRKRTKTERFQNVPTVQYHLWPDTFRLLKQHRSTDKELALTNTNGQPLYRRELKPDGTVGNTNNIRNAFVKLSMRLKLLSTKPMLLRKTSATMLETHEVYGRYAQYYLGQAAHSLTERRYAKPDAVQFNNALRWLGEQFGLT